MLYPSPFQAEGQEGNQVGKFSDRGVLYDTLKYYREDETNPISAIVDEYEERNLTLMDMIQELDIVNAEPVNADYTKKEKQLRVNVLRAMIAMKLDFNHVVGYMSDVIDEFFTVMQKDIDDLDKFAKHRHKTVLGLYTERLVY